MHNGRADEHKLTDGIKNGKDLIDIPLTKDEESIGENAPPIFRVHSTPAKGEGETKIIS